MRYAFQITAAVLTTLLTSLGAFAQNGPLMTTMVVQGVLRDSTGAPVSCPVTDSWTLGFAIKQGSNVIKATGPVSVSCNHLLATQNGFFSYQITGISPTFSSLAQGSVAVEVSGTVSGQSLNVSLLPSTVPTAFVADRVNPENTTAASGGIAAGQVVVLNGTAKLPAVDGSNITVISAPVIVGALPAISGANLTGVVVAASNITSGTFPTGVSIPATQISGGLLPSNVSLPAASIIGVLPAGVSVSASSLTGSISTTLLTGALPTTVSVVPSQISGPILLSQLQTSSVALPTNISVVPSQISGSILLSQLQTNLALPSGISIIPSQISGIGFLPAAVSILPTSISSAYTQAVLNIGTGPSAYSLPTVPNFTLANGASLLVQMPKTASAANSAAPTLAVNGGSAINLASEDGTNLTANQMFGGTIYQLKYDQTDNKWLTSLNTPLIHNLPAVASFPTATSNAAASATLYMVPTTGNFTLRHGAQVNFRAPTGTGATNAINPLLQVGNGPQIVMQDLDGTGLAAGSTMSGGGHYTATYDAISNKFLVRPNPHEGVCTTASFTLTTAVQILPCPGLPLNAAITCSGSAAMQTPGSTGIYARASAVNSMSMNTTAANNVAMTYTCMWAAP